MARYYALSTPNAALLGWRIVGIGDTRAEAAETAEAELRRLGADIYAETMRRNLAVVTRSTAARWYGVNDYEVERYLDAADARAAEHEMRSALGA